ncbi:MAG: SDR family oxidoreductase [Magnetococcales bacterium]|nr:SDR family oxidoreductase [Magnetococcales bacterium]NGZ26285.1 SDR family oxidoreductase [Magnetococcales bacterium]
MITLVTGGAGFIGSHVCEALVALGHHVRIVDDFSTGRMENIAGLLSQPQVKLYQVSICDAQNLQAAFAADEQGAGVAWVIHLAGLADIVPSIEQPDNYFRVNVQGTLNVLEMCRRHGVKRLVYAASSSCYGLVETVPTTEEAPIRPQYPYALTKYMGEELVNHWHQVYGLQTVSLRLFNVYGPRSRTSGAYGAVFGVFLAQKLNGKPFTVVGDGEQSRDFTYVTDVANAFVMAAQSQQSGKIYNVGSGGHQSINRLVALLGGEKVHVPKRPGEPDVTFADTRRIVEELGWQPAVSFEEGVKRMLAVIEDWRSAPIWEPASIARATATWFQYLGDKKP